MKSRSFQGQGHSKVKLLEFDILLPNKTLGRPSTKKHSCSLYFQKDNFQYLNTDMKVGLKLVPNHLSVMSFATV